MPESLPIAKGNRVHALLPRMANRHGLIAGATGTGKTVTLRTIAEKFSVVRSSSRRSTSLEISKLASRSGGITGALKRNAQRHTLVLNCLLGTVHLPYHR